MITLVASTRRATAVSDDAITTRSVGIPVALDLSEHFDGLSVTLVCKAGEVSRDIAVLDPDALEVPVDCLQVAGVSLLLGLYASNSAGTKVIPTIWASAGTIRVGTEQSEVSPSDPTPDWTAQVLEWAEDAHDTAERLAEQVDGWESEIDAAVDGAENVNATVSKSGDTATISVTDREGVTHTATVSDGADGQPGADGRPGADGYSPTATVTQTASGATISITDKSGTTTASVSNGTDGTDGTDGADGFSPTVDVQPITGGHEVTITDADGAHSFDVMDGDPAEPGSITDDMLAPDGIKPQVAQIWGNQLVGTLSGTIDTADDAYAAPPMALTVEGVSTQAGTPTPDAPVPILSVDDLSVHASADGGTTDYTNWPVSDLLPEGTSLRSLPDGTKDQLNLTYLRPSTRDGWAWYSRELVQRVMRSELTAEDVTSTTLGGDPNSRGIYNSTLQVTTAKFNELFANHGPLYNNYVRIALATVGVSNYAAFAAVTDLGIAALATNHRIYLRTSEATDESFIAALFVAGPIVMNYAADTPVTTTLDPIELPVLPAPTATVWCDGGSAQPTFVMEYVRDTNIVIADLRAALADLATS